METIVALLGGWGTLIGVVVAIVVVGAILLVKKYVKKSTAVSFILTSLEKAQGILKEFIPDKWEAVYDAILEVLEAVVDDEWTEEEAQKLAKSTFEKALKFREVELSDDEKKYVNGVIDWLVSMVIHDKGAGAQALSVKA